MKLAQLLKQFQDYENNMKKTKDFIESIFLHHIYYKLLLNKN